jgi:acetyl-CoA carboxylase carboxyltransferase component
MGGEQAAKTLLQIQVGSMQSRGQTVDPAEEKKLLAHIHDRYEKQTSPYYAAARLWVDALIDPLDTRHILSEGIKAANNNPRFHEFKTGVFQV